MLRSVCMCVCIYIYNETCLFWIDAKSREGSTECLAALHWGSLASGKFMKMPSPTLVNLLYPVWCQVSSNRTLCLSRVVSVGWPLNAPSDNSHPTWRAQGVQGWEGSRLVLLCHPWGPTCLGTAVPQPEIHTLVHVGILMCLDQVQCPGLWKSRAWGDWNLCEIEYWFLLLGEL